MVYSMPAQPPFLTPTRTPATGLSARAITSLMRCGGGVGQPHHLGPGSGLGSRHGSPRFTLYL